MGDALSGSTKSPHQASDRDKTPFLVYESGTPYFIPNSIYSAADYVLDLFKKTIPEEALEHLRKVAGWAGSSLQNTDLNNLWLQYFELFLRPQGEDTPPLGHVWKCFD